MRIGFIFVAMLGLLWGCDRGPSVEAPSAQNAKPTAQMPAPSRTDQLPPNHPPIHGESAPPPAATASANEAAGLAWEPPSVFTAVPPANAMRKAQYRIGTAADAPELVVHYFGAGQGGGVQQNIERWIQQVKQPDGSDSTKVAKRDSVTSQGGVTVHTLDVSGTFASNMPGQMNAGAQTDSRLLGAIAEGPQGPVFFKLVGPRAAVDAAAAGFSELVKSIHPK